MSAPAAPADVPVAAPPAPAPPSPAEYVRRLSPEDKHAVFLALLREALADNGDGGLLEVDDEAGRPFGYYVPPKAADAIFDRYGPKLTAEDEAHLQRVMADPDNTVGFDRLMDELDREDEAEAGSPAPPE